MQLCMAWPWRKSGITAEHDGPSPGGARPGHPGQIGKPNMALARLRLRPKSINDSHLFMPFYFLFLSHNSR